MITYSDTNFYLVMGAVALMFGLAVLSRAKGWSSDTPALEPRVQSQLMVILVVLAMGGLIASYVLLPEQTPPGEAQKIFNQHLGK